ncbi:ribosome biogenesis GTPase YqeH [Limosilactobacillus fermentum]|uniref:Ribosome biogenesis GTPase YqeH n=1 Tax=Limosilactobacillus fermentum TaxID=1613 RepID=A0AAJ5ZYY2_LIMFE|nr:ribosome biogenesis GTPase YqeH [Limosilactobacillus fermentum]MCR5281541.1 ribosome biogenesis GTPase YqeH [Lactobacillus sp.]MBE4709734.1 ribosome biogenesis GTPase YqeH [Limosilactobacillus fermentum]MED7635066.1 ribosome biogenesis GTPase YqeH [Limosilactobacillus fermentum]PTS39797.1 ribosome biogenesis GTPase YqeH [Limosilactobacillus fermentum]PTV36310.1 ribosome biogenesis GTPase YqeH [Limosilactobacillus fermentum]
MTELNKDVELRCIGCGAVIQTEDKDALGYTPASALNKGLETGELYCQRCFRLRHYNEIAPVSLTDDDFLRLLSHIREANALIVYVVDIFDFNGSIIPGLHRFVGKNPVLLVGNKEDLLPRSLRRSKLTDWLRQQANQAGIRPLMTTLVSAKRNHQVEELLATIEKYRQGRDVYVVGVTNVGKSTLINQIIKQRTGVEDLITTSRFPGTTLDKIEIPLDDGHELVDTPGIIHQEQMAHVLPAEDLRLVAPQKEIKPKTYQLDEQQTIFLGGIARFDYLKGPRAGLTAYFDNNLPLHRTKLANADAFYEKHLGGLLVPPHQNEIDQFPALERFEFAITEKSDLVFEGLGWITVPAGLVVAGWAPKGVGVLVRRAMI